MTKRLEEVWETLQSSRTLEDVQTVAEQIRDFFDLQHVVYHVVGSSGREYGAFTYDMEWVQRYKEEEYVRIDPVITESLRRFHPLNWKSLDWSSKAAREFYREAVSQGVGQQGMSVPIRGVGGQLALFSVTSGVNDDKWEDFLREHSGDLLLASNYMHQRVSEIMDDDESVQGVMLSPRERDVLSLLASGRSRAEAAERLKISEHTFRVYVDAARHKLGAMNTTHAVAKALANGLIVP
ncbi:helix-turn-helix transcriptional regulator [Algicella marina]|uniref:LuxR family transcriptional regulator n=1 Tax=Algicella marina TaxID=2683284 RepID=A0A6P1T6Q9_9RHOB|nr:LuxR family transcriptional regulator [Algicella marina]QHQ36252.1 LuxR family transcriptional regulator [Algicella marina]